MPVPVPVVLTFLGNIAGAVLGKFGDHLFAPIQRKFKYMCCFDSNITELEAQLERFQRTRQGLQSRVNNDRANVRIIDPNVEAWLQSASEVTTEVEGITQEKPKVKEGCLNGWCPNLKLRYSLSRKAVKKTEVVLKLQAAAVSFPETSYSPPPTSNGTIHNGDFTGFESRRLNMEHVIEALRHDEIKLIGICGMGGTGKTTMVKEIAKKAKEESLFDEVAMVVVSQEIDPNNVQACIAGMLGLKELRKTESPIVRADLLRRRLLQDNKKILVILDDIWAEMDLEDMGFPLRGANENFKMLYTSRTQYLWHDLQIKEGIKKEFPLELLSEDEAWKLFREKVGDLADARDLQPIAKKIANECGCLPLALVLVGGALSKKKGRNAKEMWEGILDRLTCASNTHLDEGLYSRLELSYEYLENQKTKRLFLFCCLFKEDEDISIEDLGRYGFGLSFFDGINEMEKVRRQVLLAIDDLKSRYLLLDGDEEGCVKVHDIVRDMGISIASRGERALVSHGVLSKWPRKDTYKHYTAISVISDKIKELPEGLTYPNLEFLMLQSSGLEKLPPDFFEGMEKLKVLYLKYFHGILTFQPLRNLTTLVLEGFCGKLDKVRSIGDLQNLEILSFRYSEIKELPEEIGELVNLRLLDLDYTFCLERIPRGVVSRLVCLEELYMLNSRFKNWEEEKEGMENANLGEFKSLSSLNTLEIHISSDDITIPRAPIFAKLKMYKVFIGGQSGEFIWKGQGKRILCVYRSTPTPSYPFLSLLRSSDCLYLGGEGCNDLVRELLLQDGVDGLQQLKQLEIYDCDTPECLANTMNLFPVLECLGLYSLSYLRQICRGPVPTGSFWEITKLEVKKCGLLENLFELPIGGCFAQLKILSIKSCIMMKEVFRKQQREDVPDATKRIEFPKLETLDLEDLPSLVGFCEGIDQIDFPKLKCMDLKSLGKFKRLFHNNSNQSSNASQEDNFGFLSLFSQKGDPIGFKYVQTLEIDGCHSLRYVFTPTMVKSISQLRQLTIWGCEMLSRIVAEENGMGESTVDEVKFAQLETLKLGWLPNLKRFCNSTHPLELPKLSQMDILFCPRMDAFSSEPVCAPNLTLPSISWNGDLNNAIQFLQKNGNDPMARSMEKPRTFDDVTDKFKPWQVAETQCRLVAMPDITDGAHKVVRLIYTNSGNRVLALGCNGIIRRWKWVGSQHNPSGMATASVVPQQWQPASGLAITIDAIGAKLEEAVPCIALSTDDNYAISACGGVISLFDMYTFKVIKKFMPPPPASTFLAFFPQDDILLTAIGMEDSTIRIYDVILAKVKSTLKGHQKRITGLAFSTILKLLVSSGADAQVCIWSIDTWVMLKSVPIQLPAGKARDCDTRVQFHSGQIRLLWVPQDVLPATISCATYSCDDQLVYVSFCDGNIGVFDADSLMLRCHITPSVYLSPALLSGSQAVYPLVVAAHPRQPNQFAIGLTDGSVIVMELPTIIGLDGGTASSSNASNQTPGPEEDVDVDEVLDEDVEEDALITNSSRVRTATMGTNDNEEDFEEKRKKEEEEERKKKKGKAPLLDEHEEY